MLLKLLIVFCLLFLFVQDWKFRAVYWFLYPVLFVLFICMNQLEPEELSWNACLNLGFLLLQLLLLTLYFSIKQKRLVNITKEHLAWGDILFLLCLCAYLSPLNYFIFYFSSLCLVAVFATTQVYRQKEGEGYKVPLAGLQSLFFAVFLIGDWSTNVVSLQDDTWLFNYLNR